MLPIFLISVGNNADLIYFPTTNQSKIEALRPDSSMMERLVIMCYATVISRCFRCSLHARAIHRNISMDSFVGNMNFGNESPKLPPSPSTGIGQLSLKDPANINSNAFSLEFGNGEFTGAELKKIMSNEKLAEIALTDPKRAKRILANCQSVARSKERKMAYISELEHKVQTLQNEATTLSAQLTLLQRDSAGLTNQNNEMKFRLQAMEQQAQLRDALNEALTAEIQRLRLATGELNAESMSKCFGQQLFVNSQMYQLQQQPKSGQIPMQDQSKAQDSNNVANSKSESKQ